MDAFTTVLDRMVEAEQRAGAQNNQLGEAKSRVQELQRDIEVVRATLSRTTSERNDLEAAKVAGIGLFLVARKHMPRSQDLTDALKAAEKFFDDIPF